MVSEGAESRRRFGVPVGGPYDRASHRLANSLLQNRINSPTLELCPGDFELEFVRDCTVSILHGEGKVETCLAGSRLNLRSVPGSFRAYLGFPRGVELRGEELWATPSGLRRTLTLAEPVRAPVHRAVRYVPNSNAPSLDGLEFCPTLRSDRMGMQLAPPLEAHDTRIMSEPATPGVIQHTPSGDIIVLGPDGPTIGGYPKLGTVVRFDLDGMAQLAPFEKFFFETIDLRQAVLLTTANAKVEDKRLHNLSIYLDSFTA